MKLIRIFMFVMVCFISGHSLPNEMMFFTADDGKHGNELWKYDKTNGMSLTGDANSNTLGTSFSSFKYIGNDLYLTINKSDDNGTHIWKYSNGNLEQITDASKVGTNFSPSNLFSLNGKLYFTANDDENGTEIRTFDDNNISQIIQTNVFTKDSSPSNFTSYNGKVIFTANTPEYGTELYETNGTNITLISDIYIGTQGSSPNSFIEYNGKLYFIASDSIHGTELRVYDGTSVSLVQDLDIGATSSGISNLTVYKNKLYFAAQYLNGKELYSYDGTSMELVADIGTNEYSSSPNYLTLFDDKIYFSASSVEYGNELFYFDGNTTTLVSNIRTSNSSSSPRYLTVAGNRLFFAATDDNNDNELYYTTGGTSVTKVNVYTGTYTRYSNTYQNQSSPQNLVEFNGDLYFSAEGPKGREFYRYDISAESSELLLDSYTGSYTSGSNTYQRNGSPSDFIEYNGKLYFIANTASSTRKLYVYSGSGSASVLTSTYTNPSNLYVANNKLYFVNKGDESEYDKDYSLRAYDGSSFTTVVSFNSISKIYYFNNKLYISANSLDYGRELFVNDGSSTNLIKDLNTYSDSISFGNHIEFNGKIVFSGSDDRYGNELWEFNGTKVNLISDINPDRSSSSPNNFIEMDNKLYFTCNYPNKGTELCVYDGTSVSLAADINVGSDNSSPSNFVVNGTTLYFKAYTEENGYELWKFQSGTASLVGDIFPGKNKYNNVNSSSPNYLTVLGDRVYFKANNSDTVGNELYYANSSGVHLAVDGVSGTGSSSPQNLIVYNNQLYLSVSLTGTGRELNRFNENNSTYTLIGDINEGSGSSSPNNLKIFNGKLIFTANSDTNGTEIFSYDGSTLSLLHDIDPTIQGNGTPRSSSASNFNIVGSNLFFTANSLANGTELYVSDGTNVQLIGDLNTKTNTYYFSQFAFFKNELYFSGNSDNNGTELWKYDLTNKPSLQRDIKSGYNGSSPYYLTKFLNKLYFRAATDNNGTELVSYDGEKIEIIDIQAGSGSSSPSNLVVYGKELFFLGSGPSGYGVYKYNGFSTPQKLTGNFSGFNYPTVCDNKLYFSASGTDGSGNELWSYDGNTTKMVYDIHTTSSSSPTYLTCVGSKLYFRANHLDYGNELWVSEGDTTKLASDIYPGKNYNETSPFSSNPTNLIAVGDQLYFSATNDANGTSLYSYDGQNLIMYDDELGKTSNTNNTFSSIDNTLYRVLRNSSYKYYLTEHPNNTNLSDTLFSGTLGNLNVFNPQPTLNSTDDIVIDEDNNSTISIVFDGFADPDNRDLNITLENNASSLLDFNISFVSGVKSFSDYNGMTINISAKTKENANGLGVFYVTLDNGLSKTIEKIFVKINPIDDKPVFLQDPTNITINPDENSKTQTIYAKDVDGDTIVYSATSKDTSVVTVQANDNNITFTPVSNVIGAKTNVDINITANGVNVGKTIEYEYVPANNVPSSKDFSVSTNEDSSKSFALDDFNFTDADANDTLKSIYIVSLPAKGVLKLNDINVSQNQEINSTDISKLIFTPVANGNGMPYTSFGFKVNDGRSSSTSTYTATINVTAVDDNPSLESISNLNKLEDFSDFNITLVGTDIDGDTISYSAESNNSSIATVSIVDGKLQITPVSNASGVISVEVNASANGKTDTKTFTLNITSVDDAPVLTTISNPISKNEDFSDFNITLSSSDAEGDSVTYSAKSNNTDKASVSVSGNVLTIKSVRNAYGNVSVDINVTQDSNTSLMDTQTINFAITPINDVPSFNFNLSDISLVEDNGTTSYDINISDIDGDDLNLTIESNNTNIITVSKGWTNSIAQGNYNGVAQDFNLSTVSNANGMVRITLSLSDGNLSTSQTFDVNISAVNDAPVLRKLMNINKIEDFSDFNITLLADDLENDNLIYTAVSNDTSKATVSTTNNILTVSSSLNGNGIVKIDLNVSDGELIDSKSFILNIGAVDDKPVLKPIRNIIKKEDSASSFIDLNTTDVDSNASTVTYSVDSNNSSIASARVVNGVLIVSPKENANGIVSIEVNATVDGQTVTKTFTYTLNSVNDRPKIDHLENIFHDQSSSIISNTISFGISDDTNVTSLSVTTVNTTLIPDANISVRKDSDTSASLTYAIAANETGKSKITVTASDGNLSYSESFTVRVNASNDSLCVDNTKTELSFDTIKNGNVAQNYIINDLNLVSTINTICSSTITWSSSDTNVIENNGSVTVGSTDSTVAVTATIVKGENNATKQFLLTVPAGTVSDSTAVSNITFQDIKNTNNRQDNIVADLTLLSSSLGKDINWSSTNEAVIDPYTFVVSRTGSDENVVLTATIGSSTKDFNLTVIATPTSTSDKLAKDMSWLNFERILDKNRDNNNVIYNLIKPLPSSGPNDSTITWTTSDSAVITTDGDVIRDTTSDKYITMTASFDNSGTTNTKEFLLRVLKNETTTSDANVTFKQVVDNNNTVAVSFSEDGSDTNTTASFDSSLVSSLEKIISDDSIQSVLELTDKIINLFLNTDGTAQSQAEFTNDDNESVISSVKIDATKSSTSVDSNGTVLSTVSIDANTTVKGQLNSDGSVSHSVDINSSDSNKTTSASATIPGSKVEADSAGNVETTSEIKSGNTIYKAVATSDKNGNTKTKFITINLTTGEETDVDNTLDDTTPYAPGNTVEISEINGTVYIKTTAPLDGNLNVK